MGKECYTILYSQVKLFLTVQPLILGESPATGYSTVLNWCNQSNWNGPKIYEVWLYDYDYKSVTLEDNNISLTLINLETAIGMSWPIRKFPENLFSSSVDHVIGKSAYEIVNKE